MIVYSQRSFVLEKFGSFFLVGFCAHCYYAQAIHLALLSHRIWSASVSVKSCGKIRVNMSTPVHHVATILIAILSKVSIVLSS